MDVSEDSAGTCLQAQPWGLIKGPVPCPGIRRALHGDVTVHKSHFIPEPQHIGCPKCHTKVPEQLVITHLASD